MNVVEMFPELIAKSASSLISELETERRLINKIYDSVNEIDSMWNGPIYDHAREQFDEDRIRLLEICSAERNVVENAVSAGVRCSAASDKAADIIASIRI